MDPPPFTLLSNKGQSEIIKKNIVLTFQWLCLILYLYKQFLRLGQNLPLSYSLLYLWFQKRRFLEIEHKISPFQLVNLQRNRRYFVIELHTWFCLSYFLKTNITFYCIYQYFMSINSFFQHRLCFSILPPDYNDPWLRLVRSSSFLIMLFK